LRSNNKETKANYTVIFTAKWQYGPDYGGCKKHNLYVIGSAHLISSNKGRKRHIGRAAFLSFFRGQNLGSIGDAG